MYLVYTFCVAYVNICVYTKLYMLCIYDNKCEYSMLYVYSIHVFSIRKYIRSRDIGYVVCSIYKYTCILCVYILHVCRIRTYICNIL